MVEPTGEDAAQNLQSCSGNQEQQDESSSVEIEENVVKLLDSVDGYLILMNSLSSALRQGWFELASARHSMGASRINSSLFDLKYHSAATTLQLDNQHVGSGMDQQVFTLNKWASFDSPQSVSGEVMIENDKLLDSKSHSPQISPKGASENSDVQEKGAGNNVSQHIVDNQARKQRLKSLSMFGALVSPKLQAAQLSFETAVETIAKIANMRASLLCAYEQVRNEMESSTK